MFEVIWLPEYFKIKIDETWLRLKRSDSSETEIMMSTVALLQRDRQNRDV